MRDVLQWIDRHNGAPALDILASNAGGDAPATDLLAGIVATDSREQSGIWSTASGVLAAYRTEGALASTRAAPLDLDAFCAGPEHALPLLDRPAPASIRSARRRHGGRRARCRLRPVPRRAGRARRRSSLSTRSPTSPPSRTCRPWSARERGRGSWCSPACRISPRPAARWGPAADGFLSLFGTTVVLRGIADTTTLRDISALAGDRAVPATTVSRSVDRWGRVRPSTSRRDARANPASRSTPSPTARPDAPSSSAPTRRSRRSRSRRRTSAPPGASSSRRRAQLVRPVPAGRGR